MFEDRLVNRGLHAEFPDFEAVYHIVIDAVDSYNEGWEKAFKDQELLKVRDVYAFVLLLLLLLLRCCELISDKGSGRFSLFSFLIYPQFCTHRRSSKLRGSCPQPTAPG